jgi:Flp pilus assembly protein TadG
MRAVRGLLRGEHAQAMVETALLTPMLVFIFIGGADLARAYAAQVAVINGARAGAEATVLDFTPTTAEAQSYAQQEMGRTPGIDSASATITMTKLQSNGSACPQTPDPTTPCFITVRITYQFKTILPWPMIPNTFNFDRSTVMRTYL